MNIPNTAPWRAEPLWRTARQLGRSRIPSKILPWLLDPDSLTELLIQHCRGRFSVQLLDQRRARPRRDEAAALGLRPGTRAIVRQVHLRCDTTPWVYARTVIPPRTLARKAHRFTTLGARSLGAMLFANPHLERGEVEIACLTSRDVRHAAAVRGSRSAPEEIWGRRSLFRLEGQPLLVSEFFLPEIVEFSR